MCSRSPARAGAASTRNTKPNGSQTVNARCGRGPTSRRRASRPRGAAEPAAGPLAGTASVQRPAPHPCLHHRRVRALVPCRQLVRVRPVLGSGAAAPGLRVEGAGARRLLVLRAAPRRRAWCGCGRGRCAFTITVPWEGWRRGLVHEDWRYDQIRGHGLSLLYWQVSLVSLHLTTTSRPACSCTARSALSVGSCCRARWAPPLCACPRRRRRAPDRSGHRPGGVLTPASLTLTLTLTLTLPNPPEH